VICLARETQSEERAEGRTDDRAGNSPLSGSEPELDERYSRQILFRGIGAEGQRRLAAARVAIIGCGATGSALVGLLARAGVGTLRIVDRDYVEPSNLQRQSLFDEKDAAESLPKAIAAARKIAAFNSGIVIEPKVEDLVPANIAALLEGMSLILDGTDNFETRYLMNDYAVERSLPWIYSAAVGSYAVTLNIVPGETACLACIFPDSPRGMVETCETSGILNSAVNLVASIAATEALKFLVAPSGAKAQIQDESEIAALKRCATQKQTEPAPSLRQPELAPPVQLQPELAPPVRRTLLSFDVWTNEHAEISAAQPRPGCRACGERDFVHLAGEGRPHITMCGRNSVQIHERQRPIDFVEMDRRLQPHGTVRHNDFVLKFWHDPYEMTLFPDGRAIIKGTTDTAVARSLYARYVGS
jgi:molybdopterin/thiamine biosynthesis adenylyltransferase